MKEVPAAAVILATYNDLAILEWSLAAFARQSECNFELILADDGSDQDYAPILRRWAPRFLHGISHVWHERKGFRKTRIQNRSVYASRAAKLIFVDIDCLPHADFVRQHLQFLSPGVALTGRRVHIEREILPSPEEVFARGLGLEPMRLIQHWLGGNAKRIEHGFELPFWYESKNNGILGSNFSISRADFVAVNGFNEEFLGRGGEDTDIDFRLRKNGVRIRCLRNKLIQYHLMHEVRVETYGSDVARIEANRVRDEVRASPGVAEIGADEFELHQYR